jgi:replicative DNA helicase
LSKWENALISKTSQNQATQTLVAHGVEERHFSEPENKRVWRFITDHISKYKSHPSFELIREEFPEYKWEVIQDPLEVIQDKFIVEVKRASAVEAFRGLAEILDENSEDYSPANVARIDEIFLDKAKSLAGVVPSSNISKFSEMPSRIDLYRQRKEEGVQIGIPFGIPRLDDWTLGLYPHEYVTIAGFTGVGKSTLALVFTINHYLEGYTPLFISLEMGADELYRKLDSISVGLRQHAMKEMTLSGRDIEKWEKFASEVEKAKNDIIIVDVNNATPDKVFAETSRWNPDVVVVDYVQLLKTKSRYKNKWEQIGEISESMKHMARSLQIPVYGLAQSNADSYEAGANLGNIGGSKDIGRHSDILIGLRQDEMMREQNKMELSVEKNRGGRTGKIDMYWNYETCIFRQWAPGDEFPDRTLD